MLYELRIYDGDTEYSEYFEFGDKAQAKFDLLKDSMTRGEVSLTYHPNAHIPMINGVAGIPSLRPHSGDLLDHFEIEGDAAAIGAWSASHDII